jgi:hypothetical protein
VENLHLDISIFPLVKEAGLSTVTMIVLICTTVILVLNVLTEGMNIYWRSPASAVTSAPPAIKNG